MQDQHLPNSLERNNWTCRNPSSCQWSDQALRRSPKTLKSIRLKCQYQSLSKQKQSRNSWLSACSQTNAAMLIDTTKRSMNDEELVVQPGNRKPFESLGDIGGMHAVG